MIVRMASVRVAPERIDEIVGRYRQIVRPVHQRLAGLRNHYVLVDKDERPDEANRPVGLARGPGGGAADARTGSRAALGGVRGRSDSRGLRGRRRAPRVALSRRTVS